MMAAAMPMSRARHGGALKPHRQVRSGEVSNALPVARTIATAPLATAGTALAVDTLPNGVAALSTRSIGRGGPRNRSDRESDALTALQIANLTAAEGHSRLIGLPFTRMITIHWQAAGLPLAGMAHATGRFIDLMTRAIARHGYRTAWIWTHENSGENGGHCHLLAHVPACCVPALSRLQRGWLKRIAGKPYRANVIHSKPIGGRLGLEISNPALHAENVRAALSYLLKGTTPQAAERHGLARMKPGGRVIGKRCGTSQNIGAKARQTGEIK